MTCAALQPVRVIDTEQAESTQRISHRDTELCGRTSRESERPRFNAEAAKDVKEECIP